MATHQHEAVEAREPVVPSLQPDSVSHNNMWWCYFSRHSSRNMQEPAMEKEGRIQENNCGKVAFSDFLFLSGILRFCGHKSISIPIIKASNVSARIFVRRPKFAKKSLKFLVINPQSNSEYRRGSVGKRREGTGLRQKSFSFPPSLSLPSLRSLPLRIAHAPT